MENEQTKTLKEELNASFTDDYIRNTGMFIHKLAEEFYEKRNLEGKVYFDDNIFENCFIDILVDIARLKHFHDISYANYIKFIAYTASWFLKRKPFQLIEGCGEEYIYVNEIFALTILLQACGLYERSTKIKKEEYVEVLKSVRQMLYHLKYRNTNPQTLELLLVGLECGKRIHVVE